MVAILDVFMEVVDKLSAWFVGTCGSTIEITGAQHTCEHAGLIPIRQYWAHFSVPTHNKFYLEIIGGDLYECNARVDRID